MIRTFLTLGAVQLLVMLVQLIRTKTLAVLLGPDQVGIMAVTDKLVAVLTQTVSLSLPFAATVFLPALWAKDRDAYAHLLGRMRAVLVGALCAAGFAGAAVTLLRPGVWGEELVPYRVVVALAFLGAPALGVAPFVQGVLASQMRERAALGFTLLHTCVIVLAAVVGVVWKGLAGFYALLAALGIAVSAFALERLVRGARKAPGGQPGPTEGGSGAPSPPEATWILPKPVWRFSILLLGLTFLAPYAALRVHYTVLATAGADAAGWMQAAVGIALAVRGVLGAANAVFLTPNVNRGGSPSASLVWADEYGRTLMLVAAAVVPPLLLWPDLAVRVLYSGTFLPGARFVALFVAVEVLGIAVGVYQSLPVAFGHMGFHVAYSVIAQLGVVASAALLVPWMGIAGAAVSLLVPHLISAAAVGAFLRFRYRLSPSGPTLAVTAATMAALAAAGTVGVALPGWSWSHAALKLLAFLLLLVALATQLNPAERSRLRSVLRRPPAWSRP